jgi:hypothetical protein
VADDITSPDELDAIRTGLIATVANAIASPEPPAPIPVRWCPNAYTSILGHLTFSNEVRDGDAVHYSIGFIAGPLHGEAPRYIIRFDLTEARS